MFRRRKATAGAAQDAGKGSAAFAILKGAFFAVFCSLILVLIFAFIIKFTNMSEKAISPVNQVIKIVSILAGIFFCLRKSKGQGLLKGIIIGLIYIILSFLVFSILDGTFKLTMSIFNDLLFGALAGAAGGVIVSILSK